MVAVLVRQEAVGREVDQGVREEVHSLRAEEGTVLQQAAAGEGFPHAVTPPLLKEVVWVEAGVPPRPRYLTRAWTAAWRMVQPEVLVAGEAPRAVRWEVYLSLRTAGS